MASLDQLLGVSPANPASASPVSDSSAQSHFVSGLFNQLVQTTRQANALPDVDEFKYLASTETQFRQKSQIVQNKILNLLGLISDAITYKDESSLARNKRGGAAAASATFTAKKDSLDRFHQLSDTVDTALEAVDLCLDAHRGVKRGNTAMDSVSSGRLPRSANQFQSSSTMIKPQKSFAHLIDNSTRTWIPILTEKPNALKPLLDYEKLRREREEKGATSAGSAATDDNMDQTDDTPAASKGAPSPKLSAAMTSHLASLGMSMEAKSPSASLYPHPYKYEIENMDWSAVRPTQLVAVKEQLFQPLAKVPCIWVDDLSLLLELVDELETVSEIAIDLEHHSFRSYAGLTCLMQISTRSKDYLIDALALRTELHRLNSSFTDPKIVKVLHGSDSDIIWLQRDFGLYIVNLFDTGQAARILEFQSFGLSYLLKHFCDVQTDKKYQLADWRMRPLSAEMLLYARMDTHYLLYIYDRLKNELISRSTAAQNQLSPMPNVSYHFAQVIERSKQIALKTYEKEDQSTLAASMEFAFKMGVILQNDVQSRILVALFKLRDDLARKEDESVLFMCNNQNLMQIIQQCPVDVQQLESCCNKPTPPLVRMHAPLVLKTIVDARAAGSTSFTSPFLASTLPPNHASPTLGPIPPAAEQAEFGALTTPQKPAKGGLLSQQLNPNQTPATQASALFAQLATSTPHQNAGWVSQPLHDAVPMMGLHASSQSPVMSTEQLYSAANWIQAPKNLERSLNAARNTNSSLVASSTSLSIPLFDDSGDSPRRSNMTNPFHAIMSPAPKTSPFAILASGTNESLENRLAMAQAHAALAQAANSSTAIASVTSQYTPAKVSSTSPSDMDLDDDAAALRTPNTGEPAHSFVSPSPMSLQVVPSPSPVMTTAAGFTSIAADVPASTAESASAAASGVASASPLPKSMREIYKISNENRRKKKKTKTSAVGGPPSTSMDGDDDDGMAMSAAAPTTLGSRGKDGGKKGSQSDGATDASSSQEFMKNIGWSTAAHTPTSTSNAAMQLLNNHAAAAPTAFESKRKHNSAPPSGSASLSSSPPNPSFHAFDYSHATLPPTNPAAQPYFNPYTDMGRDKNELKAAAGTSGPTTAANKIFKGHTQLKTQNKSVTVVHDNFQQRQRGASAGSGIPIPRPNNAQRR